MSENCLKEQLSLEGCYLAIIFLIASFSRREGPFKPRGSNTVIFVDELGMSLPVDNVGEQIVVSEPVIRVHLVVIYG